MNSLLSVSIIGFVAARSKVLFSGVELHLLRCLSTHDFIYPKILFHWFVEVMLFQTEQAVLYQNAFWAVENVLNFGISFSCLELSAFNISWNICVPIKLHLSSSQYTGKEV